MKSIPKIIHLISFAFELIIPQFCYSKEVHYINSDTPKRMKLKNLETLKTVLYSQGNGQLLKSYFWYKIVIRSNFKF